MSSLVELEEEEEGEGGSMESERGRESWRGEIIYYKVWQPIILYMYFN